MYLYKLKLLIIKIADWKDKTPDKIKHINFPSCRAWIKSSTSKVIWLVQSPFYIYFMSLVLSRGHFSKLWPEYYLNVELQISISLQMYESIILAVGSTAPPYASTRETCRELLNWFHGSQEYWNYLGYVKGVCTINYSLKWATTLIGKVVNAISIEGS